jgi:hypothetical protein
VFTIATRARAVCAPREKPNTQILEPGWYAFIRNL